jgi:hypothetical protein
MTARSLVREGRRAGFFGFVSLGGDHANQEVPFQGHTATALTPLWGTATDSM